MCGRYAALTDNEIEEIRKVLKDIPLRIVKDEFLEYHETRKEIRPTNIAPIITKNDDRLFFEGVKWGFKKWKGTGVIINARSETITIKRTFSSLIKAGRCVIPAREFYEWEDLKTGKKKYYIRAENNSFLFMAGLYRDTKDGREFVIITKNAFGDMTKIHDRMPVILCEDQVEDWLSGKMSAEDLEYIEFSVTVKPCNEENEQFSLFDYNSKN